MKFLCAASALLWAATVPCVFGQTSPATPATPAVLGTSTAPVATPRIACDQPQYDFGERDESQSVQHAYVVRNTGTAPLNIAAVRTSCGCTVATLATNMVPPGGETRIEAVFSLHGRRGLQTKTITVESDDPAEPRLQLTLRGTVIVELALEPAYLSFGSLLPGVAPVREVKLVGRASGVGITNVISDNPAFTVEPQGTNGWGTAFNVRMLKPPEAGEIRGTLTVATDHPTKREFKVPVLAIIEAEVRVIPKELILQGPIGSRVSRTVVVSPGTVSDYHVLKVDPPAEDSPCEIQTLSPGTYHLVFTNLLVSPEMSTKSIRIHTDLLKMKEIEVKLRVQPN